MADIRPIRAWNYNKKVFKSIEPLTSPLFDVISDKYREKLYENPYNSIHISVPGGEQPADKAKALIEKWKKKEIIVQDDQPCIYVYYQYFTLLGDQKNYCRKGFVANIRISDWHEEVILRHENTIPHSVNDRTALLEKTGLNVSPTHGLYTDAEKALEPYMDEAMRNPFYETEDYQGVKDVLAKIQDKKVIDLFIATLADKKVILADGHHRYEGSLTHMKDRKIRNPLHNGTEGYNFHMMYLTNSESDDLRILPTHRVIKKVDSALLDNLEDHLQKDFEVKRIEDGFSLNEIIAGKKHAFGIITKNANYKIRLKTDFDSGNIWKFPKSIKSLDLTVMHYFIIEKILGVKGKHQRKDTNIDFDRSFSDCLTRVKTGEADLALITNEISKEQVKQVCYSGYTLPQKSTYFYPKVICGFLFSSILDDEFKTEFDPWL